MKKANKKKQLFYESIQIIINHEKIIDLYNDLENGEGINLDKCLEIAKENGYELGIVLVIAESYMSGKIYRYGNYRDNEWWEVGSMDGFA